MDLRKWDAFSLIEDEVLATIKLVCIFGNTGHETLFINESDEVFGMGPNNSGCLGTGDTNNYVEPKEVEALSGKKIVGLAYGSGPHVVICTEKGEVYTWGHNGYCELGNGAGNPLLQPTVVTIPVSNNKIIAVACGSHHSLALSINGEVFSWGQNKFGQTGSNLTTNQCYPRKVNNALTGKFAVSICCSHSSSFAVMNTGEVYGWGYNGNGQLGIGSTANQLSPIRISNFNGIKVVKLACGYSHVLALTDEGTMYSWGSNSHGQLGIGNKVNSPIPVRILKSVGRITDIAAIHYNHISAAACLDFKIYMWGQCKGQCICEPISTPYKSLFDVFAHSSYPSVTHKPMRAGYEKVTCLIDTMRNAFDNEDCSDITIMASGKPIRAHKAILKLRCEHFRNMFQSPWPENNQNVLQIDQFSYTAYKAFIKYLYTDEVRLSPEEALELLELANAYCENVLKHHCEETIKHGITKENVATLYSTAITHHAKDLENFCFKFALSHMTAVVQSPAFMALDEITVKSFILKASTFGVFKT